MPEVQGVVHGGADLEHVEKGHLQSQTGFAEDVQVVLGRFPLVDDRGFPSFDFFRGLFQVFFLFFIEHGRS